MMLNSRKRNTLYGIAARIVVRHRHMEKETKDGQRLTKRAATPNND